MTLCGHEVDMSEYCCQAQICLHPCTLSGIYSLLQAWRGVLCGINGPLANRLIVASMLVWITSNTSSYVLWNHYSSLSCFHVFVRANRRKETQGRPGNEADNAQSKQRELSLSVQSPTAVMQQIFTTIMTTTLVLYKLLFCGQFWRSSRKPVSS